MNELDAIKAALDQVEDPRELLVSLFMHAPLGMGLFDPEGWLFASNEAYGRMLRPRAARSYNVLRDPRIDELNLRPLIERGLAGEPISLPRYVRIEPDADGAPQLRATESSFFPLFGVGGRLHAVGMATWDVTAEEQLARNADELRRFAESGILGVMHWNAEGGITGANDALLDMLGYTRAELEAGQIRWTEITPPEHLHLDRAALAEIAATGRCRPFEKEYIRKDGSRVPIILAGAGIEDEPSRGVCFILDITERKRVERELAERETRFRTLIAYNSDALLLLDLAKVITFASDSTTRVLGWQPDEVVGQPLITLVHPEDVPLAIEEGKRCLASSGEPLRCEVRMSHRDGSYRLIEVVYRNLFTDPVIGSVVINLRDITENRALQQQFLQAQKMEAIGRLAGGIAHDFNNMLSAILGFAGIVSSELRVGDPLGADVAEIITAAERASTLTRQLLAFSRKQILAPRLLDLGDQLHGLEKMLRRLIGEDIELDIVTTPALGLVKVDPAQIEQVVLNLVINARDAVRSGGRIILETANVELDAEYARQHIDVVAGPFVMLAVTDDGAGMEKHVRERVFEPFFTTKGVGQGTGLGLATVFGVVKQSGGHIWLYSEPGRGTTFKIYFPRCHECVDDEDEAIAARPMPERGNETILLVEDEPGVRAFARRALQRAGYVVLEAENGGEALLIFEQHPGPIDLLLTDVVMPRMSGRLLARRLVTLRPSLRVVYMSGYTENAIVHHGVLEEGTEFISKPISLETLLIRVRGALDRGQGSTQG